MRVLLSAALLLTMSCSALWSGDSTPNPRNCVANPEACTSAELCDQERQICVPRTSSVLISDAKPKLVPRRAPVTQVELSGAGFQTGARVFIGAQQIEADVVGPVSEDRIRIYVPANATACGPLAVRVVNPDSTSATEPALLRYVLGSVKPQISQHLGGAGAAGTAVAIAKLNGDGLPDIAVASRGQQRIDIFDQNASGQFQSSRPALSIMSDLFDLSAVPMDKDSLAELVVVPYFGLVRLHRGTSASYATSYQTLNGAIALNVAAADLDQDGYTDLAVGDAMANRVRVFLGARDGSGTVTEQSSAATCADMQFSAAADLNHDGFPEVLLSCFAPGSIRVYKNDGSGNLSAGPEVAFGVGQSNGTTGVAVADL